MAAPTPDKKSIWQKIAETQVWKAIFRTGIPRNRRQRMMVVLNGVFLLLDLLYSFLPNFSHNFFFSSLEIFLQSCNL